jgi:putative membrane protein
LPRINHSALVIAALTTTMAALAFPVWSYNDRSGTGVSNVASGTVNTQWGPLTASDRDLIERVRLAGLWELPAAEKAMAKSSSATVKEAADHLAVGHADLDKRVRSVAAKLNITLPNQPNAAQQGWLAQMDAAQGVAFDRTWANLLRSAHGKIFPAIGTVRNNTRNSLVRQLASDTNQTVLDHITVLEKTGQVDFDSIANGTI